MVNEGMHNEERDANYLVEPPRPVVSGMGTTLWSMLQDVLFANTSETFFLRRISSSSGDERSGRKGTNIGRAPFVARDEACFGWGECTLASMGALGLEGSDLAADPVCGYWDGAVGLGRRPELFVNGWVARGSNDENTEEDIFGECVERL